MAAVLTVHRTNHRSALISLRRAGHPRAAQHSRRNEQHGGLSGENSGSRYGYSSSCKPSKTLQTLRVDLIYQGKKVFFAQKAVDEFHVGAPPRLHIPRALRVAGASSDGPLKPWLMAPVDSLELRQDLPAVAHLLPPRRRHLQLTLGSRTLARSQSWSAIQEKFQFLIFDGIVRLRGGGRNKEDAGKGRPDKLMRGKVGKSPKKSTTKKLAPLAKRKKQSDDTTSSKSEEAELEEEDTDNVQVFHP